MTSSKTIFALFLLVLIALPGCGRSGDKAAGDSTKVKSADSATVDIPRNLQKEAAPATFAYRFKKGDEFRYSIKNVERVKMSRDTLVENNLQEITYKYSFRVLDTTPDGDARIEATCLAVFFKGDYRSSEAKKSMEYNSEEKNSKEKEKVFSRYNAPVNTPFEITVNKSGLITSIDRIDNVIARLMGDDFKTSKAQAKKMVEKDYGENGLKNIIQLVFQKFEPEPIGIDSSWISTWNGKIGFLSVQHTAVYTLKGYEPGPQGKLAHIAIRLTSKYMGDKKLDTGEGIATMEKFDIKGSGVTVFNADRGTPVRRKMAQTVFAKFFVQPPEELKKVAPEQAKDFWWTQEASVENDIEPL
jgi:hypothetical protein